MAGKDLVVYYEVYNVGSSTAYNVALTGTALPFFPPLIAVAWFATPGWPSSCYSGLNPKGRTAVLCRLCLRSALSRICGRVFLFFPPFFCFLSTTLTL